MDTLEKRLLEILPKERVKARLIDRYAYASDASHFYLLPQAVAQPINIEEVKKIFELSHQLKIPVTFRAGGTSLSGQGVTNGLLVDLSNYWRKVIPENNGERVRVEPAVIGMNVNHALKKYGRKIGPDPASISAAMMGGILSNNSSGMCCGVVQNSYHTLSSMTFVLPNGHVYNSALEEDHERFQIADMVIAEEILALRKEILGNTKLVERIRKKYKQKNTVGYCMNAFVDFAKPLDILCHLIVGGEGTLAFIAEAVLNTVPDLPYKITGMLYFESPEIACGAISDLKKTGAEALEFMDRPSLRSVENMPGVPTLLKSLPPTAAAILCEFQETTVERLLQKYENAKPVFSSLPLLYPPSFTNDVKEQAVMWKIRKGMYPSVAGMRAKGTSALMEDFTFPVERLGEAVIDVQKLFEKHHYENGIIFGHAKDGNLHFVISQSFFSPEDIALYEKFNDDLFDLVLDKYDGALKAEHSSGRAVSAYIQREWGPEAYSIMKRLKQVIDPANLLNPGIVITEDKHTHIHHLKMMPIIEEEVDKCIECGFCEQSCPSRDITLSPRQRIGVRRAMKRLGDAGDKQTADALMKDYQYDGIDTCAVDGMCATNCPVDINTGDLIKRLRRENHSVQQNKMALWVANHFAFVESILKTGLQTGIFFNNILGKNFMRNLSSGVKGILPATPLWPAHIHKPGIKLAMQCAGTQGHQVVYFSSCISRLMGGETGNEFLSVCKKANMQVIIPQQMKGTCCGQIFSSKGFADAFRQTANSTIEKLWQSSAQGAFPVVLDVTSCTQTIRTYRHYLTAANKLLYDKMTFEDIIEFVADKLLPRLNITKQKDAIVFHPVCSAFKMGMVAKLQAIGNACSKKADMPYFSQCCGMAGDRGFYFPELTNAATKNEAAEVNQQQYDGYFSSSRTCEMAMSAATGKNYQSVLKLLNEVTS